MVVAVGVTEPPPVKLVVPAPLHAYEVAAGLQLAVNVDIDPALIVDGEATKVHVGVSVGDDDTVQVAVRLPLESTEKVEYEHEFPVAPLKVIEPAKTGPALNISKAKPITALLVLINFVFILASKLWN